ncbi:MAG: hypothetical protein Q8Q01_01520 [archaeon]|nr:hypothetical protein [archaeon]
MTRSKIDWCLKQKKGIELVEENENLSEKYFSEAQETLQQISGTGSKWDVIMAYYACYNALYSILMKAGIKSEIHDCTIELMTIIDEFNGNDYSFMSNLKYKRIRAQYYLEKQELDNLPEVKKFVVKCHAIVEALDIIQLRKKINEK